MLLSMLRGYGVLNRIDYLVQLIEFNWKFPLQAKVKLG